MPTMPFEAPSIRAEKASPCRQTSAPKRRPVLLAALTVPLLADDVLHSLFSAFRVELFQGASDLHLRRASPVAFALLSGSAGTSLLALEAHTIRTQWPLARIILLGRPPWDLEDYLYDHTVEEGCSAASLIAALEARSVDLWNHQPGWQSHQAKAPEVPAESDPTKAEPPKREEASPPRPRDLPADEKQGIRGPAALYQQCK